MQLNGEVVLLRRVGDILHQSKGDGIGGVRAKLYAHKSLRAVIVLRELQVLCQLLRAVSAADDAAAESGPHAAGQRRLGDPVHKEIHIGEAGRPRGEHLHDRQLRPCIDAVAVEPVLHRPNPLFKPLHQRQLFAEAAQQRHRRVSVGVDEAGQQRRLATPLVSRAVAEGPRRFDSDDLRPLGAHVAAARALRFTVPDDHIAVKVLHPIPSSSPYILPAPA